MQQYLNYIPTFPKISVFRNEENIFHDPKNTQWLLKIYPVLGLEKTTHVP